MVDREGNVLKVPGSSVKAEVRGDELLASYARFTQKGVTLKAGQGVLELGTPLARETSTKKYVKYAGAASTNEVQSVGIVGATGGTWTITFNGETTAPLQWNAVAADVRTALENLNGVDPGDVAVTGGPANTTAFTLTFGEQYAGGNVPQATVNNVNLTGSPTVTNTTSTPGTGTAATGVCLGFLRQSVDTTSGDVLGNIVISGIVYASKVAAANGTSTIPNGVFTDLNARLDYARDYLIF
jgi:hypothetical protein